MLHEEVERYIKISGDKEGWDTSVSRVGSYLDGYDKGLEVLDKIRAEIAELDLGFIDEDYKAGVAYAVMKFNKIIDKYKAESEK